MQMVASGYGVTLIPQIAADVERRDDRVKFLRLQNPQPGRNIGLVFRRTSPRKADFRGAGRGGEGEPRCVAREHRGPQTGLAAIAGSGSDLCSGAGNKKRAAQAAALLQRIS